MTVNFTVEGNLKTERKPSIFLEKGISPKKIIMFFFNSAILSSHTEIILISITLLNKPNLKCVAIIYV